MCVCVYVRGLQTDPQGNPVSMTVPQVQLINPENQIVEVSPWRRELAKPAQQT